MSMKERLLRAIAKADHGDWDGAHEIVQDMDDPMAAWLHANLHREEGDLGNARYWYGRAGRPHTDIELAAERATIAATLTKAR